MLVIVSDLHLTDGSTGSSIPPGAFYIFAERLRDLAIGASWRANGMYSPVPRVDVLLLGDVLDVIRSARWLTADVRPWDAPQSADFSAMVGEITADILHANAESLAVLRNLSQHDGLTIPPADRMGQPVHGAPGQPVEVRIHYLVGNHDWFYHVPGAAYDAIRASIVGLMGLANDPSTPFPHDPAECEAVQQIQRRHKVLARHGDIYDPFNFEGDRNSSSLGDAIVIELINRFSVEVEQQLGDDLPDSILLGLQEIDNIRPSLLAPVWIDGLLERSCPSMQTRKQVKAIWDRMADRFLELPFVQARDSWNPVDLVDGLERVLKFSKRLSIGWASSMMNWIHGMRGASSDSYAKHALAEQDFRNRRARHVVYGHTHGAETIPLDSSCAEGHTLDQLYFNSGTWRRVHRPTQLAPSEHEFIPTDCMTYLAFYHGDERRGRPFETWSGTLGLQPTAPVLRRLDAAHPKQIPAPHLRPLAAPLSQKIVQRVEQAIEQAPLPTPLYPAPTSSAPQRHPKMRIDVGASQPGLATAVECSQVLATQVIVPTRRR